MKIIHSADQHLDSGMNTRLPKEKSIIRRAEILNTFVQMVEYAANNHVEAILLSGDLFDTLSISSNVLNTVTALICDNKEITFFYLRGNHDNKSFISCMDEMPDNLKLFDNHWKSYKLSETIVISGVELNRDNCESIYSELELNENKLNICMLHGQLASTNSGCNLSGNSYGINISKLQDKSIDYLALGHIHSYKTGMIDSRGMWCYSGCLEGRGYDEAGEKGFVLLEVDEEIGKINHTFIPFADRKVECFEIDVTGAASDVDVENITNEVLTRNAVSNKSILDIRLVGIVSENYQTIDEVYLTKRFENKYFCIRFKDDTRIKIDIEKYIDDISLKGEFVRSVIGDLTLSEEEKIEIINVGFKAMCLSKEELLDYILAD